MNSSSSAVTTTVTVFGPYSSSVSPDMSTTAPSENAVGIATTSTESVPYSTAIEEPSSTSCPSIVKVDSDVT